jgi:hypothetical protein
VDAGPGDGNGVDNGNDRDDTMVKEGAYQRHAGSRWGRGWAR